jgi:hypothetical protein
MTIKDAAEEIRKEYKALEEDWFKRNPGRIMNNYSIKIMACIDVIQGVENVKELEVLERVARRKGSCVKNGLPHGHYIHAETYKEINDRYRKQWMTTIST